MQVKTVQRTGVTVESIASAGTAEVKDGTLTLTLSAGQAEGITPVISPR